MNVRYLLPGAALSVMGVALSATFEFEGPALPDSPVDVVGWALLLVGLGLLRLGATR